MKFIISSYDSESDVVNARTGVPVARKDLRYEKRPKASLNAAFPFLPIPLNKELIIFSHNHKYCLNVYNYYILSSKV